MKKEQLPTRGLRDLSEILKLINKNRFQLILIMVFFLSVGSFYINSKPNLFLSTTKVLALAGNDFYKYQTINNDLYFKISPSSLLDLFAYKINLKEPFYQPIQRNDIIDTETKLGDSTLEKLIAEYAATIEILKDDAGFWTISATHTNKKKWTNVLEEVEKIANKLVYEDFVRSIENDMKTYNSKISYFENIITYFKERNSLKNPKRNKIPDLDNNPPRAPEIAKFSISLAGKNNALNSNQVIKYSLDDLRDQIFLHNLALDRLKQAKSELENNKDSFKAATMQILETEHKSKNKNLLLFIIFLLAGIFSSSVFITYKKFKSFL